MNPQLPSKSGHLQPAPSVLLGGWLAAWGGALQLAWWHHVLCDTTASFSVCCVAAGLQRCSPVLGPTTTAHCVGKWGSCAAFNARCTTWTAVVLWAYQHCWMATLAEVGAHVSVREKAIAFRFYGTSSDVHAALSAAYSSYRMYVLRMHVVCSACVRHAYTLQWHALCDARLVYVPYVYRGCWSYR